MNITNNEYYKDLYAYSSIELCNKNISYEINFYSDLIEVTINNGTITKISLSPIIFYKECEEIEKLLSDEEFNFNKKIVKISDDINEYYSKLELSKDGNSYILKRCDCSLVKEERWNISDVLTFEDIYFAKTFYSIIKKELEKIELDF